MKAILIDSILEDEQEEYIDNHNEMVMLLDTLNVEIVGYRAYNTKTIYKGNYFSSDKLREMLVLDECYPSDVIVFNFDLTPLQHKNLSSFFDKTVLDRTEVILSIFEQNAKTKEAKLQVEIAKLKYEKSRMVKTDFGYDQAQGGGSINRGKGEKQIDISRYNYRTLLSMKEKELAKLTQERRVARNRRSKSNLPIIAIVGYTNAGKSTLINQLISRNDKKVIQENKLFATLETSTRLISIKDYPFFLLTDTVGFISRLPTTLIEAFKSTLEEIKEADLLIQVVDISTPNVEKRIEVTNNILKELGIGDIKTIYLYNKCDLVNGLPFIPNKNELFTCLKNSDDISHIVKLVFDTLYEDYPSHMMNIPYSIPLYKIKSECYVLDVKEKDDGYHLVIKANDAFLAEYSKYILLS